MRHAFTGAVFALTLPLAACFDADVVADFNDPEAVRLEAVMQMAPDTYQLALSLGGDPCPEGVAEEHSDGSMTCTLREVRSLDELIALQDAPDNDFEFGEGISIEEFGGGLVAISFDLSEMFSELPPPEERAQASMMFGDAFDGHGVTMRVVGEEIISTNGEIVDGGTTARFYLPLELLFTGGPGDYPETFDVTLRP